MISKKLKKKRIMEQFSLKKYLANPSRKLVTRDGKNVRIICTNRRDLNYPIIALIETSSGGEVAYSHTKDGRHCTDCSDIFDLFFAPEKHEGWVNIYRARGYCYGGSVIYPTEVAAKAAADPDPVATIKIEWEE